MTSEQKQRLIQLKERIKNTDVFAYRSYVDTIDNKDCFCGIGHAMDLMGVDVCGFKEKRINWLEITTESDVSDSHIRLQQLAKELKSYFGLSNEALRHLQYANDYTSSNIERKSKMLYVLDHILAEEG